MERVLKAIRDDVSYQGELQSWKKFFSLTQKKKNLQIILNCWWTEKSVICTNDK